MDLKYVFSSGINLSTLIDHSPYKFEAPWNAWEFAYHVLHKEANLVILSMAWLTREDARSYSRSPKDPDMETLSYWLARLEPLIRAETEGEIICVFANRTGIEGDAVYAGTSAVLGIHDGEVKVYGILGRGEKELLIVDTNKRPQAKLISEPNSAASLFTRSQTSGTSLNSINSMMTNSSGLTVDTENTACTTPDAFELSQKIGEAIPPLSPVHPSSPSAFFAPKGHYPEAETLKETLRSSIGQPQITPAQSNSPAFDRPPSPKSRNASRNRQHEPSELAPFLHDHAEEQRGRSRVHNTVLSPTQPQPHSAAAAPDRYQASFSTLGPRSAHQSPRPKSAMW
jgi:hypothetical protein